MPFEREDKTGQIIGPYLILSHAPEKKDSGGRKRFWNVICTFCDTVYVKHENTFSRAKSCGCVPRVDTLKLEGQRFHRLLVLERLEYSPESHGFMWKCICDCGEECKALANNLVTGRQHSCGCYRTERIREKHPHLRNDLTGKTFGILFVIKDVGSLGNNTRLYLCKCDCGKEVVYRSTRLVDGTYIDCGCRKAQDIPQIKIDPRTRAFRGKILSILKSMINRCHNPKSPGYREYGERGIEVCKEWRDSPDAFYLWSIKNGWQPKLSIERLDVNKGYSPDNCEWILPPLQIANRRNTVKFNVNGKEVIPSLLWVEKFKKIAIVKYSVFSNRLARGVEPYRAATAAKGISIDELLFDE